MITPSSSHPLDMLLQHAPMGIGYTDEKGFIQYTNKAFDGVFGYARDELIGRHLSIIYDTDVAGRRTGSPLGEMAATLRLRGVWGGELRARRKDGSTFDTHTNIEYLETENGAIWMLICEDITERKRHAKAIQESRKEQEALLQEQVAAQTAAAMAHEINQPLLAISSYVEAALRMLRSGRPDMDTVIHALDASIRQTQRAGHATRALLDIMNRMAVPYESIDLELETRNTLSSVRFDYEHNFRFRLARIGDGSPVYARRIHVQKVLINLMRNAVESMKEAGVPDPEIKVSIRRTDDEAMQVTVHDNGPGVDPKDVERVFNPFYTTKSYGMGMGLTICRSLIEANGGRFWLDPGPGGTFHFTLPISR
jgi:PAS domain S-box-containing protein